MKDKKNKNDSCYIVYEYNDFKNDYTYIKEYTNIKAIQEDYKQQNKKSIYQFIYNSLDDTIKHLLKDKYIIIKDTSI